MHQVERSEKKIEKKSGGNTPGKETETLEDTTMRYLTGLLSSSSVRSLVSFVSEQQQHGIGSMMNSFLTRDGMKSLVSHSEVFFSTTPFVYQVGGKGSVATEQTGTGIDLENRNEKEFRLMQREEERERMRIGAKNILHNLLAEANEPLNSDELWALAETKGLRSKTFMKRMCEQMRKKGHIRTRPMGEGKKRRHGYILPGSPADLARSKKQLAEDA